MKLPNCEISPNALFTPTEKVFGGLGLLSFILGLLVVGALVGGCRAFYENSGSHTRVGSLTAPVEVSDASESAITVRALYSMDGADVWTARDSLVKITYRNCYTNNYFAIVKTQGEQDLAVEIEPLSTDPTTNAAPACCSGLVVPVHTSTDSVHDSADSVHDSTDSVHTSTNSVHASSN